MFGGSICLVPPFIILPLPRSIGWASVHHVAEVDKKCGLSFVAIVGYGERGGLAGVSGPKCVWPGSQIELCNVSEATRCWISCVGLV